MNVDMFFSKKLKIIQEGYKFLLENLYPVIQYPHETDIHNQIYGQR